MKIFLFFSCALLFAACVSHKSVTYFNDLGEIDSGELNIPDAPVEKLRNGDLIEVTISSISLETNRFFQKSGSENEGGPGGNTYRISKDGNIEIPLVGSIKVAQLTIDEATNVIREALLDYVQKPSVNVRLVNFRITLLGEVDQPGVYNIPEAEANVLEALAYGGDLTIYGTRSNVMVIRTEGDEKHFHRLNLNESDFMESEYFHLKNNDVVYVQPTKGLTSKDDNIYRILPLVISSLTFVAVVISLSQ